MSKPARSQQLASDGQHGVCVEQLSGLGFLDPTCVAAAVRDVHSSAVFLSASEAFLSADAKITTQSDMHAEIKPRIDYPRLQPHRYGRIDSWSNAIDRSAIDGDLSKAHPT